MKIIVDGMGGDNAPLAVLQGCAQAVTEYGVEIIITGKKQELERLMEENEISRQNISIIDAPTVISMEDDPISVVKDKRNSSMGLAFDLLKNGDGDAMLSAGNTGALLTGATLIVKRIDRVKRAALAPVIPNKSGLVMLIDSGANSRLQAGVP